MLAPFIFTTAVS